MESLPVIDNFTRANEDPIGTSSSGKTWTFFADQGTYGVTRLEIISNQCAGNGGAGAVGFISDVFNPSQGATATVATKGASATVFDLGICGVNTGSLLTLDAYALRLTVNAGTDTLIIGRIDNATFTALTTINQEITDGDGIGITRTGSLLTAYYRSGGAGAWTIAGTATDSTYTSGGVISFTIGGTIYRITDFRGGSLLSPAFKRNRSFSGLLVR